MKHGFFLISALLAGASLAQDVPAVKLPAPEPPSGNRVAQDLAPGNSLAQHPFLYCGGARPGAAPSILLLREGKVAWSFDLPAHDHLEDCTMLSNGSVVFAYGAGASIVRQDKKIIWTYEAPPGTEIRTAYPIDRDRVLVMQSGDPATVMVINTLTGSIEQQVSFDTANPKDPHDQFGHVRLTPSGNYLAAHLDLNRVMEYTPDGRAVWGVRADTPWSAVRLRNGDTLIGGGKSGYVREVDKSGKTVWEIRRDDLPGLLLEEVREVTRLANGNTLINNYAPDGSKTGAPQVVEVTPQKKLFWVLRNYQVLGPAISTQLLDDPGLPERRELQR